MRHGPVALRRPPPRGVRDRPRPGPGGPRLDAVVARQDVDADRIALVGWSLGGYLALRAASGEHRLAACVADPGLYSIAGGMIARMQSAGVPESVIERFPAIDASDLAPMAVAIHGDRAQRWAVERRWFWVHGATDLAGYLHAIAPFTLDAIAGRIQCPTLITMAESDPLAASAGATYDAIRSPKTLIRFETADGADAHCEMNNRTLHDQRAFDWLDGIIGAG